MEGKEDRGGEPGGDQPPAEDPEPDHSAGNEEGNQFVPQHPQVLGADDQDRELCKWDEEQQRAAQGTLPAGLPPSQAQVLPPGRTQPAVRRRQRSQKEPHSQGHQDHAQVRHWIQHHQQNLSQEWSLRQQR